MKKHKDNSFDTDFIPKKVATDIGYGFKKLDMDTIVVERPLRIAGKRAFKIQHKFHKVTTCAFCKLPAVWYDVRVREQFNRCQQCETINQFIVKGDGFVSKRGVDIFPDGYEDRSPYRF